MDSRQTSRFYIVRSSNLHSLISFSTLPSSLQQHHMVFFQTSDCVFPHHTRFYEWNPHPWTLNLFNLVYTSSSFKPWSNDISYWKPSWIIFLFTSQSLFTCVMIWFIFSSPNRPKLCQDRDTVWFGLSCYPQHKTPNLTHIRYSVNISWKNKGINKIDIMDPVFW